MQLFTLQKKLTKRHTAVAMKNWALARQQWLAHHQNKDHASSSGPIA